MTAYPNCMVLVDADTDQRCGKPGTVSYRDHSGRVYAECVDHMAPLIGGGDSLYEGQPIRFLDADGNVQTGMVSTVGVLTVEVELVGDTLPHALASWPPYVTVVRTEIERK